MSACQGTSGSCRWRCFAISRQCFHLLLTVHVPSLEKGFPAARPGIKKWEETWPRAPVLILQYALEACTTYFFCPFHICIYAQFSVASWRKPIVFFESSSGRTRETEDHTSPCSGSLLKAASGWVRCEASRATEQRNLMWILKEREKDHSRSGETGCGEAQWLMTAPVSHAGMRVRSASVKNA